MNWRTIVLVGLVALPGSPAVGETIQPARLRCEYLVNPLAIDTARPRLSWTVKSALRGQTQTAYRLLVASSPEALAADQGDLWDSGKVVSDESIQIEYAGKPLASRTRCYWKVQLWGKAGQVSPWSEPACWTMGLLSPDDWQAEWIEVAQSSPAFRPAHNGYHSQFAASADAEKWVTIDLGKPQRFDAVVLHPARPYDWSADAPGFLFPVRYRIDVSGDASFASFTTVVDQTKADVPNPGVKPVKYEFTPASGRYVRLFVTRLALRDNGQHALALCQMQVLLGDVNLALHARVQPKDAVRSSTWAPRQLTDGILVPGPARGIERHPAPMVRKTFRLSAPAKRAVVCVSALGLYELRLNGRRVGDQILAPEWTDYHRRIQYQAYDVTNLLHEGENALGAILGDGWYAGRIGLAHIVPGGPAHAIYGANPRLIVQLEIETADGQIERIVSDDSWRSTTDGPIRRNDILDGEVYDARKEMPGWDSPGFKADAWKPVTVVPDVKARLVAQPNEPIRVVEELKPVAVTEPKPGVIVFDLGQNMVGWCRFTAKAAPGTMITLRHGEALNPDGTLYTANLRGAPQTDQYTFRTSELETFEPHFTYHGFQYVEITGLPAKPDAAALVGRVFNSSSPEVGRFECSSPMLTRLAKNIFWTQRANLMSTPTDCPQRDERLGWMGDIQVFSPTACFNMDMAAFFTKWVRDIRDAQADDGRFPDFAPHPFGPNQRFSGVPAWGDAGVFVPWRVYTFYGDKRLLAEHFEAMCRWIEYVRSRNPDLIWRVGRNNDYNDWLNADTLILDDWPKTGGAVPKEVLATAFFAQSTELVAKTAAVLGRTDDATAYGKLADQIKAAFCREFVKPDGRIQGDTQAGYALALHFHLLPEALRQPAAAHMVEGIHRYRDHISTGIQSTLRLMLELTDNGYNDLAYQLANNRTMPSWGYSIDQGATTIWERWDGFVKGRGFQNPGMNSMNHWALGAVGEWMVRMIGGVNLDESQPAFKHFVIRPRPGGGLTWAKVSYDSIRGPIAADWKIDQGRLTLAVTIPANTTATVYVPTNNGETVREGHGLAKDAPGVKHLRTEDGNAVFAVSSGQYTFTAD